ncbi:hypothetical protein SOVF_146690 isoform B [Spinacia oleracea]|nr:hypothetical protein SOVF_146690 isoform B [Spinacia oleracea]
MRGENGRKMLEKMMDVKEAKKQILFSLPMILTNVFYSLIPVVSVMFAGHLGQLQLAGSTLANSWATVTGFSFMLGLSGALETLCGQGFGANLYKILGIYLQASCIISLLFSIIISVLWWFTEPILNLLHQTPDISKEAALYMRFLIPGIFAYGILQNILRFLQTQSVVFPLVVLSFVPLLLHCGLSYLLVHFTTLGYKGAALATSITFWFSVMILIIYVNYAKKFEHTWKGLSKEAFCHVFANLKLALPSAAMVCLEYSAFEILVLLAGLMPNPETTTSLIAIWSYRAFTNKNRSQARPTTSCLGHNIWAGFFSRNASIIKAFASMTPLLCSSIFLDSIQGILSGVCRGCGWQHLAVYINLGTFYAIGMPIAYLVAFKLHLYAKGLWIGLICGLVVQSASLFLITRLHKWKALELSPNGNENSIPV